MPCFTMGARQEPSASRCGEHHIHEEGIRPDIPYSAKFSRVFNFANFANFQPFAKIFQPKFLPHGVQCARAANSRDYMVAQKYTKTRF